jgi:Asp-tRNA(Asn)/Glu-tRNA(Gln) amidotransferase A subunit family amidase
MDQDPLRFTAGQMADSIRAGNLTATELIARSLARAHALQARCNCFVSILDDEASRHAEAADRAVRDGRVLGPLTACRLPSRT